MTPSSDFSAQNYGNISREQPPLPPMPPVSDATPPVGETSPQVLAREAAAGSRAAAWRLMIWILKNDPRAVVAVSSLDDDRLADHLLEFIAQGTWAGKPFVVPLPLRSAYARMRLRTLFMPGSGMNIERARRVLLHALHSPRPALRANAAHILGLIAGRNDAEALIEALNDVDYEVRLQAAKALGHVGTPDAVPVLITALRSADEQLGIQIFQSLVQLGGWAVPALIAECGSASAWTRWYCIRALGEINDERAVPILAQSLNDPDHGVAWMAARELVQFGKQGVQPLLYLLMFQETSPWLAETASYVFHQLYTRYHKLKPYLEPVFQEMQAPSFKVGTAQAARKALENMERDNIFQLSTRELSLQN
ncbi:HEAT repeat domain-containing protein [Dictyobacter vulcani]|nr:HEAT repeat domain-containing protein [Dictyobacter vulcani]